MWVAACRNCDWTSLKLRIKDAAAAQGQLHEQAQPGHTVEVKEVNGGTAPNEPAGEDL